MLTRKQRREARQQAANLRHMVEILKDHEKALKGTVSELTDLYAQVQGVKRQEA